MPNRPRSSKSNKVSAALKVASYLARRNHSETELRSKLRDHHDADEIDKAIQEARDRGWLLPPTEMSRLTAASLSRRGKSSSYINQYLEGKGLPPVESSINDEIVKGLRVLKRRWGDRLKSMANASEGESDLESLRSRQKLISTLRNRGFDDESIRGMIDVLKNPEN